MPESISPLQFWLGIITILAPQLVQLYMKLQDIRASKPVKEAEADEKVFQAWANVAGEYARQVESLRRLEVENASLRPLALKVALIQQENVQMKEDKEDWKNYSLALVRQLEDNSIIPLPFQRMPHNGIHTREKLKTISDKVKAITVPEEPPKASGDPVTGEQ